MKVDGSDFYAALIHELKNTLGLLSMTIDSIPMRDETEHDEAVAASRVLCQGSVDRLKQALIIYKSFNQKIRPVIEAYSTHDLMHAEQSRAVAFCRGRLKVELALADDLPVIWFFDRDLIEMALTNAIHNSLAYARSIITLEAAIVDGYLSLTVRDDSDGYPAHILAGSEANTPYRTTGTGLGLQFARLIAQNHDNEGRRGELRLYNDPGAVFQLLLP